MKMKLNEHSQENRARVKGLIAVGTVWCQC